MFTAFGLLDRSRRARGQVHVPQLSACPARHADERFSLFAYPWDLPADVEPVVYARNPAGAEATAHFWFKVFPKKFRTRDLPIDDAFLDKVVNQIDPGGIGRPADALPEDQRRDAPPEQPDAGRSASQDRQTVSLERAVPAADAIPKWNPHFADKRTYIYKGKKVDRAGAPGLRSGGDAAHRRCRRPTTARCVWADNLGIYGNCVVVDHGYGLQSIYGHLSEFAVKAGDMVKKGQALGKSDSTGLAGGDHLHFSMQVDGVQVNPVEWWDEHWIHDRILSKVGTR